MRSASATEWLLPAGQRESRGTQSRWTPSLPLCLPVCLAASSLQAAPEPCLPNCSLTPQPSLCALPQPGKILLHASCTAFAHPRDPLLPQPLLQATLPTTQLSVPALSTASQQLLCSCISQLGQRAPLGCRAEPDLPMGPYHNSPPKGDFTAELRSSRLLGTP